MGDPTASHGGQQGKTVTVLECGVFAPLLFFYLACAAPHIEPLPHSEEKTTATSVRPVQAVSWRRPRNKSSAKTPHSKTAAAKYNGGGPAPWYNPRADAEPLFPAPS
jgi:hypothetical protein